MFVSCRSAPIIRFNHIRTNGLRGYKCLLFEGEIRIPFIVWCGGDLILKGKINDATLLSAMGMFNSISSIANT